VSEAFDSNDYYEDTGGLDISFHFLKHEYYSRDLSQKIKAAKREKMRRGEAVRKDCTFGYKLENGNYAIDEPAAETVKLMYGLALEGKSLAEIARRLYEGKRPTITEYHKKAENPTCTWNLSGIRSILIEEQYTGTYIAGRTKSADVGSKAVIHNPESEWIKIPNHHPAIIEKSLFDAVREAQTAKSVTKTKRKMGTARRYKNITSPLKGKVFCGCCGHTMTFSQTANAKFHCRFTRAAIDAECYGLNISGQELVKALYTIIRKQIKVVLNVDDLGDVSALDLKLERQSDYEKQIARQREEKIALYERFIMQELSVTEYKAAISAVDAEQTRLKFALADCAYETKRLSQAKAEREQLLKVKDDLSAKKTLTLPLADALIDKVKVFPNNHIEIEWKISGFTKKEVEVLKNVK
jgi:hypothetical protein